MFNYIFVLKRHDVHNYKVGEIGVKEYTLKNKVWKSAFTAMADMSVTEIAQIADRRMYEEKSC